jgi:uncharacterized protein (TIGR00369 family)
MALRPVDNADRAALAELRRIGAFPAPLATSPLLAALRCQVAAIEPGTVRLSFAPGAEFTQGSGAVAGGIVATMLDFALAFSVLLELEPGESAASVSLAVHFLAPVSPAPLISPLLAQGRVLRRGRRIAHAEAELRDEQGLLLATAQSPLALRRD